MVKALAKEFTAAAQTAPDADATADQDAVVAAVTSASTKAPETPDVSDDDIAMMSTEDFHKLQNSLGVRP